MDAYPQIAQMLADGTGKTCEHLRNLRMTPSDVNGFPPVDDRRGLRQRDHNEA